MPGGHDELYSGKRDVLATLRVIGLARSRHLERIGQGATVNFANEFTRGSTSFQDLCYSLRPTCQEHGS